jgi:hypothetical protein
MPNTNRAHGRRRFLTRVGAAALGCAINSAMPAGRRFTTLELNEHDAADEIQ